MVESLLRRICLRLEALLGLMGTTKNVGVADPDGQQNAVNKSERRATPFHATVGVRGLISSKSIKRPKGAGGNERDE